MYDVVIVGGGCAGFTASIYSARAKKKTLIIERERIGGQITYSPLVENYPGIKQIDGNSLADSWYEQAKELGVKLEVDNVLDIKKLPDGTFEIIAEYGKYQGKAVILATGVKHRKLGIPREDELEGKGISYCAICDGALFRDRDVAVVGGGNAAVIEAFFLANYCRKVYLIHRRNTFRADLAVQDKIIGKSNVIPVMSSKVVELVGDNALSGIVVENTENGEKSTINVDAVFVSIGKVPSNEPFRNIVKLDEVGYIVAGENCKTSEEGIFAAGDCRTKTIRQLTTAAADGTIAALAAIDYLS